MHRRAFALAPGQSARSRSRSSSQGGSQHSYVRAAVTSAVSSRCPGVDDLLDADYGMPELSEPRLPLFTETEAHELLAVLRHFGAESHDWGVQARGFALELAARVPSREP